jgi:signal transduction histidine kinase
VTISVTPGSRRHIDLATHGCETVAHRLRLEALVRRFPYSTAVRLSAAFAAILALFAAALLVELGALRRIAQAEDELARLDHAKHAGHTVAALVREQYIHQAHTIIVENDAHLGQYAEVARATAAATQHLVGLAETADERQRAEEIARLAADCDAMFQHDIQDPRARHDPAALLAAHERTERETMGKVDELNHIFEMRSTAALARTETQRTQARVVTMVCFGLAILVAGLVGLWLTRSILGPITALRAGTERVGAGDLQGRIEIRGGDEFAALAASFNQMTADLLRKQEALVRSNRLASIGQIAAGVAHEINNPLGVILGYTKVLRREPELAAREELQIIEDEVRHGRRIVQDLLDLARPQRLELEAVDLAEAARDAVQRLGETDRRGDVIVTAPPPEARVMVRADEARIRQVIVNVLLNAIEAATAKVTLRAEPGGALIVTDDGPGMTPEVLAHVFEPFFTTKRQGTGVGLAIAQAIIDAHGGRIEVASTPGAGTRVTIAIPEAA